MAQDEVTNAHLHKVLSHRNYMHHVSLQKQLNVYDKQKKLVEKELNGITKVRETIQHINRNLPKKSPTIKKRAERHGSPKKANSSGSLLIENGMAMDRKELTKQEAKDGNLCSEEEPNSGNELQLFGRRNKSNSHQSLLMKSEKMVAEMKKQFIQQYKTVENEIVNGKETPRILRKEEAVEESSSEITFKEQITPVSIEHQRTREKLPEAEEIGDSSNLNNEKTNEDERKLTNQPTPHSGNKKHFTPRRPLYRKSCSAPNIPVQKLEEIAESETKVSERCKIYQLTKRPAARIFNEKSYSSSEDNLYKKTLLENHLKEGIKLPPLGDKKHDIGISDGNTDKGNGNVFQSEKRGFLTSSPVLGAYSNGDYCFVERSRHRQRSVCDVQTTKPNFAWSSPQEQEKPAQILSTFPKKDICPSGPLARSETVCMDYPSAKCGRARSKTVSFHLDNPPRSTRDFDWFLEGTRPRSKSEIGSAQNRKKNGVKTPANLEYGRNKSGSNETVSLTEDECISIKGKFKQIGHSALAIALMKKMTSTK